MNENNRYINLAIFTNERTFYINLETLRKAADVLGVLADSLRSFPEEIQAEICDAMKNHEASDELSAHKQYEEIEKLWRKKSTHSRYARNTGMKISSLMQLSKNEKLNLMYEYAILEHDFISDKEKIRRHTVVWQGFLTQSPAKSAGKTCGKRCETGSYASTRFKNSGKLSCPPAAVLE